MLPDHPDDQAQLFYLVLLGLFIASGMFWRYRDRLGQALQHAAIWGLIFMGVMIVYGFKDQLGQQLFTGAPRQVSEDTIAFAQARDGHFHAILDINGVDVPMLVDTGASAMVLTARDAERVGIDVDQLRYSEPVMTANGQVLSAPVRLDSVELGPFADRNVPAIVTSGALDVSLLGMSYLDRFRSWSVEDGELRLSR